MHFRYSDSKPSIMCVYGLYEYIHFRYSNSKLVISVFPHFVVHFPLFGREVSGNLCVSALFVYSCYSDSKPSILCVSALFVHFRYSGSKPSIQFFLHCSCISAIRARSPVFSFFCIVRAFPIFRLEAPSNKYVTAFVHLFSLASEVVLGKRIKLVLHWYNTNIYVMLI
jgi:hypothetical protein